MDQLRRDSAKIFYEDPNYYIDAIAIWKGDAAGINKAIREGDLTSVRYLHNWIKCFEAFDYLVFEVQTNKKIIVRRDRHHDVYHDTKIGTIVNSLTYTSTCAPDVSPETDKAGSFGECHTNIILPPQTHCFYYSVIDGSYEQGEFIEDDDFSEHEIILPPGKMRFDGFQRNGIYQLTWISGSEKPIIPIVNELLE